MNPVVHRISLEKGRLPILISSLATKMSGTVTLYDLPSKDPCKAWSLNPWKSKVVVVIVI
jgi:hypothetical protein